MLSRFRGRISKAALVVQWEDTGVHTGARGIRGESAQLVMVSAPSSAVVATSSGVALGRAFRFLQGSDLYSIRPTISP